MVPIIDTLPSTHINSAKEHGKILQENYFTSEMFQDLKNQRTIFEPDTSRSGKRLKANQPKSFSYHKKKFRKEERSLLPSWYDKWTWLHNDEAKDSVYCIICKNVIRVENTVINTGYSKWKHAKSTDKGFHQHESPYSHQQAIQ